MNPQQSQITEISFDQKSQESSTATVSNGFRRAQKKYTRRIMRITTTNQI